MAVTDVIIGDATKLLAPDTSSTIAAPPASDFDVRDLETRGLRARVIKWLVEQPWFWAALRTFKPIVVIPGKVALTTRYDHVQDVLRRDDVFHVPFGPKVSRLNGGPNFLLGMQAGDDYWRYQSQVMQAFRRDDAANIVASRAAQMSQAIISSSPGELDAVEGLITRVPILLCEAYYGVPIPDKVAFGHWTIAMSTYAFGDPGDDPHYRRAAEAGGRLVREVVDKAILNAKTAAPADTVLGRLLVMQKNEEPGLSDEVIRSYLIGLITGFVPTNTMAAGHMLEMLLRRPDFMAPTRAAALAGDDGLLERCLFEAMRFMPLNPGPWRRCNRDYTIAEGMWRAKTIPKGMTVLAGTRSAMFDSRRVKHPRKFDPSRPPTDYMLFGHGLHWCIGAFIARAQITQTFKALLVKPGLRRASGQAGKLQLIGPFPRHLRVEFDS